MHELNERELTKPSLALGQSENRASACSLTSKNRLLFSSIWGLIGF